MEAYMWIIWLALFVLMLGIEALGPELVSIWFSFGALIALIISFIPGVTWWIELLVFVVISIATLLAVRPIFKKYFKRNTFRSNVDSIVGKRGFIVDEISTLVPGTCKIGDVTWTAISVDDRQTIKKDEIVEVVAVSGNKLIVKKVEVL